jgi:hypothetical protein
MTRKERFALVDRALSPVALANSGRLCWQACRLLLLLLSISYLPSAHAQGTALKQTPPRPSSVAAATEDAASKPRMTEPLEKYNMPPAYIYRLETGPRMISQFGLFTSFQVNVDASGNNIVGDTANEPCITWDPNNPNRMAIG